MRNVLVLPDGTQQDFTYPPNRDIEVGIEFQVVMMDDNTHKVKITKIDKQEKAIYYYTSY